MIERLSQKSTWIGIASLLFAAYKAIWLRDLSEVVPAITAGMGLVAVNA